MSLSTMILSDWKLWKTGSPIILFLHKGEDWIATATNDMQKNAWYCTTTADIVHLKRGVALQDRLHARQRWCRGTTASTTSLSRGSTAQFFFPCSEKRIDCHVRSSYASNVRCKKMQTRCPSLLSGSSLPVQSPAVSLKRRSLHLIGTRFSFADTHTHTHLLPSHAAGECSVGYRYSLFGRATVKHPRISGSDMSPF
jgi:hypothetical protein